MKTCGKLIAQYDGSSKPCPNKVPCPMPISSHSGEPREDKSEEYQKGYQAGLRELDAVREQARGEERGRIQKMINEWTRSTCHTRAEHSKPDSDCPGWSHEDDEIRGTLLSQISYAILTPQKVVNKKQEE